MVSDKNRYFEVIPVDTGTTSNLYIAVWFLVAFILYIIIPLLFALFRRKPITRTKYFTWCFVLNFVLFIIDAVTARNISTIMYFIFFLFTLAGCTLGTAILKKKKCLIIKEPNADSKNRRTTHDYTYTQAPEAKASLKVNNQLNPRPYKKMCPYCNEPLYDNAKFCQNCGRPLQEEVRIRLCQECGNIITPEMKFCNNCGHFIGE